MLGSAGWEGVDRPSRRYSLIPEVNRTVQALPELPAIIQQEDLTMDQCE